MGKNKAEDRLSILSSKRMLDLTDSERRELIQLRQERRHANDAIGKPKVKPGKAR